MGLRTLPARVIKLSPISRYAVAVGVAVAAILLRLALDPVWGIRFPYITLFPAIMVGAWLGGLWPGLVTTAICGTAATYYWIEPRGSWGIAEPSELIGVLLFVGVSVVISALNEAWRRGTDAIAESQERLDVTLGSIGDAVIVTDNEGRVTRMNPVAVALTGWAEADALERPLEDIFRIVNEHTRQPVENPALRAIREGRILGLANHTILIARDGSERPVDDAGSPIRGTEGQILGAVLIFRDITERRRAEHALQEQREWLRVTLSSIGDAVIATDIRGSITFLNPVAEALTGWNEQDAMGRPLQDVFHIVNERTRQPVENPALQAIRVGRILGLANHTILIARDGSERPIDDAGSPIRDADGNTVGAVLIFRDVTDRRLSDRERATLVENEHAARVDAETAARQLQVALEAGRMGTWEYSLRSGSIRWSPGLEAIHGFAAGTFPGTFEAFRNEIHPADRDRVLKAIAQAVEEHRDHHVEYRIVRADGAIRWVEGRGQLFLDESRQPDRMVGVCSDITERKQAEERFRMAVEAAPAAMLMVDQHGRIALANALAEQLLGYARDEIVGQPVDRLVPPRFRERHPEYRTGFFAEPGRRPMGAGRELHALRKDGSEIPVEIGLSPIQTHEGTFVLAAVSDITDRKLVEEQRSNLLVREQAARAELERASRLKDEFLAALSHELRTPLNAVLGYAHLLNSGALPPERSAHALQAIQRNAHSQARLVESLLDLSRIMAGKLELDLQQLDLSRIVDAAVDVIRPDADARGVSVEVLGSEHPVALVGDGGRLQQVLWNLLSNAVKFTPREGRVTIRWEGQDGNARLEVSDTGQGIGADFLPHIFDRFSQADGQKGHSRSGLGLGLALVREMVQAHKGTVVAASPGEGRGSTFIVTLPQSAVTTSQEPGAPTAAALASLPQLDVLIVDDDGDVRDLLALLLESRGAVARAVSSAAEALDAIRQRRPDALLADLRMPDEDGFSLIRKLRALEREQQQARLPAIAVTAHASPRDREEAMAAGYDWHVAKPVDPEDLARAIASVVKADRV